MTRPTRQTAAGRAYLDLQNLARRQGVPTQELLTQYVAERWLARLARSAHIDQFVLKGGVLMAALHARRVTVDADLLARNMPSDEGTVVSRVAEIAQLPDPDDGVTFLAETAVSRPIRSAEDYPGIRINMGCSIAAAKVRLTLDVNVGDPVTPAPRRISLPALRPGAEPIDLVGYPLETVLAEKLATAVAVGALNTRVRDYADILTLLRRHRLDRSSMYEALVRTSTHRGHVVAALSGSIDGLVRAQAGAYTAYRNRPGANAGALPAAFGDVVRAVVGFADPLAADEPQDGHWDPDRMCWRD